MRVLPLVGITLALIPTSAHAVTVNLSPPIGCIVESIVVTHTPATDTLIAVSITSRCELPSGVLRCESTWREDRAGRHQVEVVCAPTVTQWGDYP